MDARPSRVFAKIENRCGLAAPDCCGNMADFQWHPLSGTTPGVCAGIVLFSGNQRKKNMTFIAAIKDFARLLTGAAAVPLVAGARVCGVVPAMTPPILALRIFAGVAAAIFALLLVAPAQAQTCAGEEVPLDGECVLPEVKCEASGWYHDYIINCAANIWDIHSGESESYCSYYGTCRDAFGPNLDFPPAAGDPYYVYNCDPDGARGLIPATVNTIRATECMCARSDKVRWGATPAAVAAEGHRPLVGGVCVCPGGVENDSGDCVLCPANQKPEGDSCVDECSAGNVEQDGRCAPCPAGSVPLDGACVAGAPENRCKSAGWTVTVDNQCAIPLNSPGDGDSDGCFLDGGGRPQCVDVFGISLAFPQTLSDPAARFAYDCGLDMVPFRENTEGRTECAPDPQTCRYDDVDSAIDAEFKTRVSLQFDICRERGWGAKKHPRFDPDHRACYCDIKARDAEFFDECYHPSYRTSQLGAEAGDIHFNYGNALAEYYFGPTLRYLPQRTRENEDLCFVANCLEGTEPSTFNPNGATQCACPEGMVNLSFGSHYYDFYCVPDTPENKCQAAGWGFDENQCYIPVSSPDDGDSESCFFSGGGKPQCSEVFGVSLAFPEYDYAVTLGYFAYNCGTDFVPAGENTQGEMECAPDPLACHYDDVESFFDTAEKKTQVSLQFDACRKKGWGAKHGDAPGECFCNIKTWDRSADDITECPRPAQAARIGVEPNSNLFARHYFGAALRHLPRRTGENADSCFVAHCQNGMLPSGLNMNGETECMCPDGKIENEDGGCVCPAGTLELGDSCVESCPAGRVESEGACVPCPVGRYEFNGGCVALCPTGRRLDEAGGLCACRDGKTPDANGQCACPAETHKDLSGYCVPMNGNFEGHSQSDLCAAFGGTDADDPSPDNGAAALLKGLTDASADFGVAPALTDDIKDAVRAWVGRDRNYANEYAGHAAADVRNAMTAAMTIVAADASASQSAQDAVRAVWPDARRAECDAKPDLDLAACYIEAIPQPDWSVCKGLDKAGTFCVVDSEPPHAFPCRGLFKRLRTCNLTYNRPALNPFICDAKCANPAHFARGKDYLSETPEN